MLTRDKDAGCRIYPASAAAAELLDGSRECERTQSVRTNPKRANEPKPCERTQTVRTNPKRANEPKACERTQSARTKPKRANEPNVKVGWVLSTIRCQFWQNDPTGITGVISMDPVRHPRCGSPSNTKLERCVI